jgi:hypothetical protein
VVLLSVPYVYPFFSIDESTKGLTLLIRFNSLVYTYLYTSSVANITRLFYWLGDRFDTALLVQSFLMIFAQVGLLRISLKYQTPSKPDSSASNTSILSSYSSSPSYSFDYYIDFLALLFSLESVLFILFQRYDTFIQAMGFFSLGLESTVSSLSHHDDDWSVKLILLVCLFVCLFVLLQLPIPQLITNFRRKSLAGLSSMVLFGWLFGDSFKSIYLVFLMPNSNSIQFKIW